MSHYIRTGFNFLLNYRNNSWTVRQHSQLLTVGSNNGLFAEIESFTTNGPDINMRH